jgi:cation diffusion facilitator family transporter
MHAHDSTDWEHDHRFGADIPRQGERRTSWVVALTVVMMVIEIAAGSVFGSMALSADGWHMGTHAAALGITLFAYAYARRHADDPRYTFGTGKVGALGGFASAIALWLVALLVLAESGRRLWAGSTIRFDEAITVALVGLAVNVVSALLLRDQHDHHEHDDAGHHHDHNLRAAYMHVMADALTSVLAIVALLAGRHLGWSWMDPTMGVVGGLIIARWSLDLLRQTGAVLLDAEVSPKRCAAIRRAIEDDADNLVVDLHLWRVGPKHIAAVVSVVSHEPKEPAHYKRLLAAFDDLAHVTVEVHRCAHAA